MTATLDLVVLEDWEEEIIGSRREVETNKQGRLRTVSFLKKFVGKNLIEIDLINRFGIQVVAVRETDPEEKLNYIPTGKFVVKESDVLILLGPEAALEKLSRKVS